MHEAESICVSLDMAKKLYDLGFRPVTVFSWYKNSGDEYFIDRQNEYGIFECAAPTAEEILRRLPWKIERDGSTFFLRIERWNDSLDVLSWRVIYPNLHAFTNIDNSLANASASMWLFLKEHSLLPNA